METKHSIHNSLGEGTIYPKILANFEISGTVGVESLAASSDASHHEYES